jgi:hypothetical protein
MGACVIERGRWDHVGARDGRMVIDPRKGDPWGKSRLRGRQNPSGDF